MSETEKQYHDAYHDELNWGPQPLADDERHALQRHLELIGDPDDVVDQTAATKIAGKIQNHWGQCRNEARQYFSGTAVLRVLQGMYQALIFGQNGYVEGASGTAKTATMRFLCDILEAPFAEFDASADASDFSLIGGEVPGAAAGGGIRFEFRRAPVLMPGALGLMIDELPRLPANASNVLLQAMAERRVKLSLPAVCGRSVRFRLSPNFFLMGVGNPVGYGGQGERSWALFDRFGVGLWMPHPTSAERIKMYENGAKGKNSRQVSRGSCRELGFTLRQAQAAMKYVEIKEELLDRLCAASFAISPQAFRSRNSWSACPQLEDMVNKRKVSEKALADLTNQVESYLAEGSNPRGELHVIRNTQIISLMDQSGDREPLVATAEHMADAFRQANLVRLKTNPGCEAEAGAILNVAAKLFFSDAKA